MNLRDAASAPSPRAALASETADGAAAECLLLAALPHGWSMLGRCRFGTAGPGPCATGCHALAHPGIGIALIDIAPDATPNAESRLRRALGAADFWSDFPGYLPVWHGRLDRPAIRDLAHIVQERFSTLPPLTVAGGPAWIGAVRRAMAHDAAWEVPGQAEHPAAPLPLPDPDMADEEQEPRRGWRIRGLLLLLGFLGTFGLGLGTGLLLLSQPEPPPPTGPSQPYRATLAEPPTASPVAAAHADSPTPAPTTGAATAEPGLLPQPEPVAEPEPAAPMAVTAAPLPADDGPDALETADIRASAGSEPASAGSGEPPAPVGTAATPREPVLPPMPPPTPHRVAQTLSRPGWSASGIDRTCALALFRFQQGETLSAAELAYVRNGCVGRR